MHGYDVKATLESWGAEGWAGVSYGSVYFALKKMASEGLLDIDRSEKGVAGPERILYRITDAGRSEFDRLVRELWWDYKPLVNPFAVAITFLDALPTEEALAALRARIAGFRRAVEALPFIERAKRTHAGPAAAAAVRLGQRLAEAELAWLEETAEALEAGRLS